MNRAEPVAIDAADHVLGPSCAKIEVIQYGSYLDPECRKAHEGTKEMIESFAPNLRLTYRHFVHGAVEPQGFAAANLAEYAAQHGKFWEMHDLLFQADPKFSKKEIERLANRAGLDPTAALEAVEDAQATSRIREQLKSGALAGVCYLPTFFVNGTRMVPGFNQERISRAIRDRLAGHFL